MFYLFQTYVVFKCFMLHAFRLFGESGAPRNGVWQAGGRTNGDGGGSGIGAAMSSVRTGIQINMVRCGILLCSHTNVLMGICIVRH